MSSSSVEHGRFSALFTYGTPPLAAAGAIVPVFRDLVAKSAQQRGQTVSHMPFTEGLKQGFKASPTVGLIVGTQMVFQNALEKAMETETSKGSLTSALGSSAVVGTASAPILAVFNGQTMGWGVRESLRKFTPKQCLAIAVQETAFVGGLSAADKLAIVMKKKFGDNKPVEYTASFMAGAAGSLAGHPANTALTRWQSGMTLDSFRQSMWGATRKARAVGFFAVGYKFAKETLNTVTGTSK